MLKKAAAIFVTVDIVCLCITEDVWVGVLHKAGVNHMIAIMSEQLMNRLLGFATGERNLDAGQTFFAQGDKVRFLAVVISGELHLLRREKNGRELILQRAVAGCVVAEASLYAGKYHCACSAATDSVLALIPKNFLHDALASESALAALWAEHLAAEVRNAREQIALLGLRTVAERLDAWLLIHQQQMPERGQWQALASELGVSAEALYREIARRNKL